MPKILADTFCVNRTSSKAAFWGVFCVLVSLPPTPSYAVSTENSAGLKSRKACSKTQEYITTIEFLRTRSEWALPEAGVRQISRKVAQSCPGSAARFIQVGRLLSEAGVTPREALATSLKYAASEDEISRRFVTLFKKLFLESELDLNLRAAVSLAHQLSADFEGTLPGVEYEFVKFADFCVSKSGLDQGKQRCANFAAQVIQSAKEQSSGLFRRFSKAYEFLTSRSGANLTTASAATLAAKIVAAGDVGTESFIQAYRYALSSKGLRMDRGKALDFSKQLVLLDLAKEEGVESAVKRNRRRPDVTMSTASRAPAQARPEGRE